MMPAAIVSVWAGMAAFYLVTVAVTIRRYGRAPAAGANDGRAPAGAGALPPCSIVVPIKGSSPYLAANVAALAALEPRPVEILLAIADDADDARPVLAPLAERYAGRVSLLVGEDSAFRNPKLRNAAKAYRQARAEVILFLDDNVALDAGLYRALLGALRPGVAAATAAPIGRNADGFAAEIEAATCNGYLFRIETFLGLFAGSAAFGNALAFRKRDLEAEGGLAALTVGPCEDNAASKALRPARPARAGAAAGHAPHRPPRLARDLAAPSALDQLRQVPRSRAVPDRAAGGRPVLRRDRRLRPGANPPAVVAGRARGRGGAVVWRRGAADFWRAAGRSPGARRSPG